MHSQLKKIFLVKLQAPAYKFAQKQTHLQKLVWEGMSWDDSTALSLNNKVTTL